MGKLKNKHIRALRKGQSNFVAKMARPVHNPRRQDEAPKIVIPGLS
jgi:hypothetical protein